MAAKLTNAPKQGVLKRFGYQVGAQGPMRRERQKILGRVFGYAGRLDIEGVDWAEWGGGESAERLQKISNTLYALKVNLEKKQVRGKNEAAISDYTRDLDFPWPDW